MNSTYEPDFDQFLNVDEFTPTSATATPHQSIPSLAHQTSSGSTFGNNSQPTFSGPSFQYDAYRQQTGLPVGGLANTFAVNQNSGLNYFDGRNSFVMPNEINTFPLTKIDEFDFANSFDMGGDMDFEDDSPTDMPGMTFSGNSKDFVSPTSLVTSNASPVAPAPVQRMYPGMHSQQAAQKAQQAQQKQQELIRQQQQNQQVQIPGQKPLPKGPVTKDPAVEESISRILSQMRQKRESEDDEESTPGPSMARTKKEEDDMDEDERLLASEEGKKLSSKERRQLRNKVSARAFRSRRKEYIGQLEGDLAVKSQEADALRHENQQLRAENNRLTDLTRMLLSSSAFSSFLQDLSQSGMPVTSIPSTQAPRQERPQPQPTRKDVDPHEASRKQQSSQQQQVGMVLMPETHVDMSLYDIPAWTPTVSSNDALIYSVTSLPEPVLDIEKLSSKPSASASKLTPLAIAKSQPILSKIPEAVLKAPENPATPQSSKPSHINGFELGSPKAEVTFVPVLSTLHGNETGTWGELQAMCDQIEESVSHLRKMMP